MLPGETILSGADPTCCGEQLPFRVLHSGAGFYIGTFCTNCGPYSRESDYFATEDKAKTTLADWRKQTEWAERIDISLLAHARR